jgi:hypothetical protein
MTKRFFFVSLISIHFVLHCPSSIVTDSYNLSSLAALSPPSQLSSDTNDRLVLLGNVRLRMKCKETAINDGSPQKLK